MLTGGDRVDLKFSVEPSFGVDHGLVSCCLMSVDDSYVIFLTEVAACDLAIGDVYWQNDRRSGQVRDRSGMHSPGVFFVWVRHKLVPNFMMDVSDRMEATLGKVWTRLDEALGRQFECHCHRETELASAGDANSFDRKSIIELAVRMRERVKLPAARL